MELIIPNRNRPTRGSFPTAPKKVRHWLSELYPLTDANATQNLLRGLKHCNRLENTPRTRFEVLDLFRPVVRDLIETVAQRYTGQSLPMAPREQSNYRNVITLLQEMAFGYKIVVSESAGSAIPGTGKIRHHAIVLALDYLNELALRHLQVYEDIPDDVWQDCNTLYRLADEQKIHQKPIGREISTANDLKSPEHLFAALHVLYLSGSHSLRRGKIVQLQAFIAEHIDDIAITLVDEKPKPDTISYGINLDCAAPAATLRFFGAKESASVRALHLEQFMQILASQTSKTPKAVSALYESDVLTREILHRLNKSLSCDRHERLYSREFCHEKMDFLHGLKEIYAIFRYAEQPIDSHTPSAGEPELTIESSGDTPKTNLETDFITHPGFNDKTSGNTLWDAVAHRNVASSQQKALGRLPTDATLGAMNDRGEWVLLNRSEGGLGLVWLGDTSPHITVGELVASRKLGDDSAEDDWITGVVTWMRVDENAHLRCGIAHIARVVEPVLVERTRGSHNSITTQTECLMATTLDEASRPCIFVPAYMFHTGESINIRRGHSVAHYKLVDKIDSTGSFSLFSVESSGASLTEDGLAQQELQEYGIYPDKQGTGD